MKEKISDLSKGKFQYKLPDVILSTDRLLLRVAAGEQYHGSFWISNSENQTMETHVFCDEPEMELPHACSDSARQEILYIFHAEYLSPGQTLEGVILMITCFGEYRLPYEVNVVEKEYNSSIGPVSDLFQFSGLVRSNWEEARNIFTSEAFASVFLQAHSEEELIYRGLIRSSCADQAMEEFLRAIRKKTAVLLQVEKQETEYHLAGKPMQDEIRIKRNTWGFLDAKITTDSSFVILERESLSSGDFIGETGTIPFVIDPSGLKAGKGVAHIHVTTMDQDLVIEFMVYTSGKKQKHFSGNYKKKSYLVRLLLNLEKYQMGKMTAEQYTTSNRAVLYGLQVLDDNPVFECMSIHLNWMNGRKKEAEGQLSAVRERLFGGAEKISSTQRKYQKEYALAQAFYWYLLGMMQKDQIEQSKKELQKLLAERPSVWYYEWLYLLLVQESESDGWSTEELWNHLLAAYQRGIHSPFLYLTAWQIVKASTGKYPSFREDKDVAAPFLLQVLNWAGKKKLLDMPTAMRYLYLIDDGKRGSFLMLSFLKELYEAKPAKELLQAICSLLLRENKTSRASAVWYALGIEKGLKMTGLYEAYIEAFDWDGENEPDNRIYTYFWKDNSLNDRQKELLYARIINGKEKHLSVYQNYQEQMMQYGRKKLTEGIINEELGVLYRDLLQNAELRREVADALPSVLFRCHISTNQEDIVKAIVLHTEKKDESIALVHNRQAYVDCYTDNVIIMLESDQGYRYVVSRPYEQKPLLPASNYLAECYAAGSRDDRLLLALSSKVGSAYKLEEQNSELEREILELSNLDIRYRNDILSCLIRFYYDQMDGEMLEKYLSEFDLSVCEEKNRVKMIDMMLMREMFVLAGEAIHRYGYRGVSIKYLQRFCDHRLSEGFLEEPFEKKTDYTFMIHLCWYLFSKGCMDTLILEFLSRYYEGTTDQLHLLWEACIHADMQVTSLEAKLLEQMLFTENILLSADQVYRSYAGKLLRMNADYFLASGRQERTYERDIAGKKLVRTFLSYLAYRYLVMDQMVAESLFTDMKNEVFYDDAQLCKMATLKYYSRKMSLNEEEREFSEIQLAKMVRKGSILPFFSNFIGRCKVPPEICHKSYAVYVTNPGEKVEIHSRLIDRRHTTPYRAEEMPDVFYGIHVKELVLFYGEKLQYYISVTKEDRCDITESAVVELSQADEEAAIGQQGEECYQMINLCLMAQEMRDESTQSELMKQYVRQKYVKDKLFLPL